MFTQRMGCTSDNTKSTVDSNFLMVRQNWRVGRGPDAFVEYKGYVFFGNSTDTYPGNWLYAVLPESQIVKRMVQYTMEERPKARRFPTLGFETKLHGRQLLLFGGQTGRKYTCDLWRLDLMRHSWRELSIVTDTPPPRCGGQLFLSSAGLRVLCGGYDGQGRVYDAWKVVTTFHEASFTEIEAPDGECIYAVFDCDIDNVIGMVTLNDKDEHSIRASVWLVDAATTSEYEYITSFVIDVLDIKQNVVLSIGHAVLLPPKHCVDLRKRRYMNIQPIMYSSAGDRKPLYFFDKVDPCNIGRLLVTQNNGKVICYREGDKNMWYLKLTNWFSIKSELLILALLYAFHRSRVARKDVDQKQANGRSSPCRKELDDENDNTYLNITGDAYLNITGEAYSNITGEAYSNITGEAYSNITGEASSNITGDASSINANKRQSIVTKSGDTSVRSLLSSINTFNDILPLSLSGIYNQYEYTNATFRRIVSYL